MTRAVLLVAAIAACGGDAQQPIGSTAWAVRFDRPLSALAVIGPSGHVAAYNDQRAALVASDGFSILWAADFPNGTQDASLAVDASGAAYLAKPIQDAQMVVLSKRAPDGSEVWSQTFTVTPDGFALVHAVMVEAADTVLVLLNNRGAVDFGAGPVGEPSETTRGTWGRFDRDGALVASGVIDFEMRAGRAALWPDRDGWVVPALRLEREQLVAFDGEGQEVWSVDGPSISTPFCLHEDGELSVVVGQDVVRLDAEQHQRWRVEASLRDCTPLLGGSLIGAGADSGPECLQQIDSSGVISASECFDSEIALARGLSSATYAFQLSTYDEVDLHDLHIDQAGDYIVSRQAPQ